MDDNKIREEAREDVEALPAETAAGNIDPDSDGPDTDFGDAEENPS